MIAALSSSAFAFQAPLQANMMSQRPASSVRMGVEDMIGKYSLKPDTVYDPLNLASTYDNNWLREAELKHGRLCMLAVSGWLTVEAGITFPGAAFEGIGPLEAHDKMTESGHMWALLAFVGVCESLHMSVIVPKLDGDWGDYEPGNYGLDPLKMDSPQRRMSELKNGRLAMLGFSGLVTQAALGLPYHP